MSNLPKFKTPLDRDLYVSIFEDKLEVQYSLMNLVKNKIFGDNCSWQDLESNNFEVIETIATNLMYKTDTDFKEAIPEYKTDDDDIFVPYRNFRETVAEVINQALDDRVEKGLGGK